MTLTSNNLDTTVQQVNAHIGALMRRDLGLGLLFVTGRISDITRGAATRPAGFMLHDGEYELRADLAPSVRNPPALCDGQTVRVTAWLGFYYAESRFRLIVKDIEVLDTPVVTAPAEPQAASAPPAELFAPPAAALPDEVTGSGLAPGILPPWLEEIRRRQFGVSGQLPAAAQLQSALQNALRSPSSPLATAPAATAPAAAVPDEIPDTPAPDPELQAWLANLFDASENEDIELKRSESEIVALRAQEPGAGSTKAEAGRFRSIGATASAKLQSPGPAEALPAPPSAVRDILNQQTMPHRPISRLDAAAMGDVTMRSEPIARPSALQSRGSAPEPVLEVKPRLHLGYLVAALLTLCVLLSLALGGAAWLLGYLH